MSHCTTGCGRPAGDTFLCETCWRLIERDLGDVAALVEELETTISRQAKTGQCVDVGSRAAEKPLLFHQAASGIRDDLRTVLVAWVRILWETNGSGRFDCDDSLIGLSRWLMRHPTWCRLHPAADELCDEITDAIRRCWQVIDRAPDRMYAGPCSAVIDGVECTEQLYANPNKATVHCRTCSSVWWLWDRRQWLLEAIEDEQLTATEISQALPSWLDRPVTPAMIRGWVHRGRLTAVNQRWIGPRKAAAVYRVGDVLSVLMSADVPAA